LLATEVAIDSRCDKMCAMAKKKQTKKHRFKYTEPNVAAGLELAGGRKSVGESKSVSTAISRGADLSMRAVPGARDFSYVGTDVRKIAIFAVALVALEVVLWYVFTHTGVGNSVYSSFSIG
jgi:hypothetical protein